MDRSDLLKASPPMFQSGLLDRFTRVHPLVPVVIFLPAIVLLFATGVGRVGCREALGLALGGYALWTLDRVLDPPRDLPLRARGRASARACTGWSTASTTTTRTTRCGS